MKRNHDDQNQTFPFINRRSTVNRRAFLPAAGGVAIGLPFLEG